MEEHRSLVYGPCNRNYGAVQGNVILDGCGEFIQDTAGSPKCVACGCHSSFHLTSNLQRGNAGHNLNPRNANNGGNNGERVSDNHDGDTNNVHDSPVGDVSRKKSQRRYKEEEVVKMRAFATGIGWTMTNKERNPEINGFCEKMGMSRQAFRIWMNNNKRYLRLVSISKANGGGGSSPSSAC